MNEDKLLIRIAEMYYQEDKNQSQIAKELAIHRSTISRLLKKSREEGIVQVTINYDKDESYELEKRLQEQFGLMRGIVVRASSELKEEQRLALVAAAADEYFTTLLTDGMTIGFSWGATLSAFANHMTSKDCQNILCLPLIGGPAGRLISDYHVNTITYEAAKKINGRALLIDAPAFPESKELKEALLQSEFNQELAALWQKVDIAVFGIGSPHLSVRRTWIDFYGEDVLQRLTEQEVVGDVISRFYNDAGQHVSSELDERLIGASLAELMQIPIRIGLAETKEKAVAILGALRGGYANVLVTTEETAREVLRLEAAQ